MYEVLDGGGYERKCGIGGWGVGGDPPLTN